MTSNTVKGKAGLTPFDNIGGYYKVALCQFKMIDLMAAVIILGVKEQPSDRVLE